jgi:DNA-binding NtrC family response regulator
MKKKVILIEFSKSLLSVRTDILERQNYEVVGVLESDEFWERQLSTQGISAVILGHESPWDYRNKLIDRLICVSPHTPIVALLLILCSRKRHSIVPLMIHRSGLRR